MPRTPTDYSKSVIYKIEHIDKPELLYVGSTTNFTNRKSEHKTACNNEKNEQYDSFRPLTILQTEKISFLFAFIFSCRP